MGVGSEGAGGAVAPLDFYSIDKVEGRLMVLFFGLVFPVATPVNFSADALVFRVKSLAGAGVGSNPICSHLCWLPYKDDLNLI